MTEPAAAAGHDEAAANAATPAPSAARSPMPADEQSSAGRDDSRCEDVLVAARRGELSPAKAASVLYAGCDDATMKSAGLKERMRILKDTGRLLMEKDLRKRTMDLSAEERIREYQTQAHLRMVCAVGPSPTDAPAPIELPKLKELTKLLGPISFEMNMLENETMGNFNHWVEKDLARLAPAGLRFTTPVSIAPVSS